MHSQIDFNKIFCTKTYIEVKPPIYLPYKIGENAYYTVYTSQIEPQIDSNGAYYCKEGDIISVSVKNTNKTMSQTIRGVFYSISGGDVYSIAAQHSGVVTATGSN